MFAVSKKRKTYFGQNYNMNALNNLNYKNKVNPLVVFKKSFLPTAYHVLFWKETNKQ